MTLQHQLSRETNESAEDQAFRSRLSRVVSKLFTRVIKAEEAAADPFNASQIDLEALVCWMDDLLVACDEMAAETGDGSEEPCRAMVNTLVEAIVRAHGGTEYIQKHLDAVGIDRHSSALGLVIEPYETTTLVYSDEDPQELQTAQYAEKSRTVSQEASKPATLLGKKGPSKDVASLVSALVSAPVGPAREAALDALRNFKAMHGDAELNAHLAQVSSTFRAFIEEQLGEDDESADKVASDASMSDRLRNLRSRLQATEVAVQSAVEDIPAAAEESQDVEETDAAIEEPEPQQQSSRIPSPSKIPNPTPRRTTRLARPSPSKLAPPTSSRLPSSSSQTLRERLAVAQESRKGGSAGASGINTSMGRAAALRARLEAVKKKGKNVP